MFYKAFQHHSSSMFAMLSTMFAVFVLVVSVAAAVTASEEQQCRGKDPMSSMTTFLGMELDYDIADRICCNNHRFAEPKGYHDWPEVDFYSQLDPNQETVFYDSVCGLPLFVAPRGRTFEEFVEESLYHGWPSFRPAEIISENVILHDDGRMESKCLTHLGHNLPNGGIDRYCIDLVCIAGTMPLAIQATTNTNTTSSMENNTNTTEKELFDNDGIISASEFNATSYESSAVENSGKYPKTKQRVFLAVGIIVPLLLVFAGYVFVQRRRKASSSNDKGGVSIKSLSSSDPEQPPPPVSTDAGTTNSDECEKSSESSTVPEN